MSGMLEDPDSHCLFFSPIIRVIFDWGKCLTSVFVIPWVCNTTWHRTWTVVSLGVDRSVMHSLSGTRLLDTWCIVSSLMECNNPSSVQTSEPGAIACNGYFSQTTRTQTSVSALFHSLTAHMLFLPSSGMLTPEITDLLRCFSLLHWPSQVKFNWEDKVGLVVLHGLVYTHLHVWINQDFWVSHSPTENRCFV